MILMWFDYYKKINVCFLQNDDTYRMLWKGHV
jgi:hypothetical protein